MAVHSNRLAAMARRAPTRCAIHPNTSEPAKAMNCTIRNTPAMVDCGSPSSTVPKVADSAITVWMPSL